MSKASQNSLHGWKLWLVWNLVTDLGLILAHASSAVGVYLVAVGQSGTTRMDEFTFPERVNVLTYFLMSGLSGGFFLGLFQWLVMRTKISRGGRWIWATTIGWALSSSVNLFLAAFFFNFYTPYIIPAIVSAVSVVIFGLAQWLVLRGEVQKAGWWVLANVIGSLGSTYFVIPLGIVTGFALIYLFKRPTVEAGQKDIVG